jgi:hypothetical protein
MDRRKPDHSEAIVTILTTLWPIALLITVMLLAASCGTTPDGRRALSPGARAAGGAVLGDVLACGLPLLAGALAGEPDYLGASSCHLRRVGERLGGRESAPAPSTDHGRAVLRAAELEQVGERREAKEAARACEAVARARLGEGGQP